MSTTIADVFELIDPADPDSIRSRGAGEFLLNWVKGGYDDEQGSALRQNDKIAVLAGPYQPEDQTAITHQIKIKVL
jgi:hypothetical protein